MSELGKNSDRYATRRRSAKIDCLGRNFAPPNLADRVQASKNRISTGLSNIVMSLNRDDNWFSTEDTGQFTILNGPLGVTLILCLSVACQDAVSETELIASFRIDDKKSYSRPESTLIEALRMMSITTVEGEIVWSCPALSDHHLNADDVITLLAEKLANYILRRLERSRRYREKENLKQTLSLLTRKLHEPH
ncbi:MAG: hypothetical protein WBL40_00050 [Terrimicrobiaceae bacterium]